MRSKAKFVGRLIRDTLTGEEGKIFALNGAADAERQGSSQTAKPAFYEVLFWDGTRVIPASKVENDAFYRVVEDR